MKIHSLPVRVVSRVERTSVRVELVREDQGVGLRRIVDSPTRLRFFWSIMVDETEVPDDFRDLA